MTEVQFLFMAQMQQEVSITNATVSNVCHLCVFQTHLFKPFGAISIILQDDHTYFTCFAFSFQALSRGSSFVAVDCTLVWIVAFSRLTREVTISLIFISSLILFFLIAEDKRGPLWLQNVVLPSRVSVTSTVVRGCSGDSVDLEFSLLPLLLISLNLQDNCIITRKSHVGCLLPCRELS